MAGAPPLPPLRRLNSNNDGSDRNVEILITDIEQAISLYCTGSNKTEANRLYNTLDIRFFNMRRSFQEGNKQITNPSDLKKGELRTARNSDKDKATINRLEAESSRLIANLVPILEERALLLRRLEDAKLRLDEVKKYANGFFRRLGKSPCRRAPAANTSNVEEPLLGRAGGTRKSKKNRKSITRKSIR